MAILLPLLSGYMGALFAPANPLINGTLGGFVGACVFSGVMSAIAAPDSRAIFAGRLSLSPRLPWAAPSSQYICGHDMGSNPAFNAAVGKSAQ